MVLPEGWKGKEAGEMEGEGKGNVQRGEVAGEGRLSRARGGREREAKEGAVMERGKGEAKW